VRWSIRVHNNTTSKGGYPCDAMRPLYRSLVELSGWDTGTNGGHAFPDAQTHSPGTNGSERYPPSRLRMCVGTGGRVRIWAAFCLASFRCSLNIVPIGHAENGHSVTRLMFGLWPRKITLFATAIYVWCQDVSLFRRLRYWISAMECGPVRVIFEFRATTATCPACLRLKSTIR